MPTSADLSARATAILARLNELRSVCEAATPGPWLWQTDEGWGNVITDDSHHIAKARYPADRRFIAPARTALPILVAVGIAEVERAQAEIEYALEREATAKRYLEPYHPGKHARKVEAEASWSRAAAILDRWSPILEAAENP